MKCANCGKGINEGNSFCIECGTPVPKNKICIKCGQELPMEAKFCLACGATQMQASEDETFSGINMGDKNVIAGDVNSTVNNNQQIHHNETIQNTTENTTINNTTNTTTNNTTNTTNINFRDDTKESCQCSLCGKHTIKTEGYTCTSCGNFVCANDFNKTYKVCKKCSGEHVKSNGKISAFKVFQDRYTELENSKTNNISSIFSIDGSITERVTLIHNFEIQENFDEIIKYLHFSTLKISGSNHEVGAYPIQQAFKQKNDEILTMVKTMNFTPAQISEIQAIVGKQKSEKKKRILTIVAVLGGSWLFMMFIAILCSRMI